MTVFRIYFDVGGDHVHCRLFSAKARSMTFTSCGKFVVRKGREFRDLVLKFDGEFLGDELNDVLSACEPFEDAEQMTRVRDVVENRKASLI